MPESPEESRKHRQKYMNVFYALMVLTVITVLVAYFRFLTAPLAITIAILIAVTKGSLVGGFFMHLIGEKKIIYYALLLTLIFFAALMALPVLTGTTSPYQPTARVSLADQNGGEHAEEGAARH